MIKGPIYTTQTTRTNPDKAWTKPSQGRKAHGTQPMARPSRTHRHRPGQGPDECTKLFGGTEDDRTPRGQNKETHTHTHRQRGQTTATRTRGGHSERQGKTGGQEEDNRRSPGHRVQGRGQRLWPASDFLREIPDSELFGEKSAYINTHLPTYLPTNLPTYLPTYLPTHPPTLITYLRTYLHTYIALHYTTLHT